MTEFTRTKMHFALALIGTLFAVHSFIEKYPDLGFRLEVSDLNVDWQLKVSDLFVVTVGLLAFTVYCYAIALVSEKPSSRMERLGNLSYALAILIVPFYGTLWASSWLADYFKVSHLAVTAPATALGLGILWLILAWWLRGRLGDQDRQAKIATLATQEVEALARAPKLFEDGHYDLAVIEAWKALEARLRRVLLMRGQTRHLDRPDKMIDRAAYLGLIKDPARKLLQEVRQQWNVAVSTEPLTREGAESALSAARHILSTIPVDDPKGPSRAV
jgi:HEPN domain-containing protein